MKRYLYITLACLALALNAWAPAHAQTGINYLSRYNSLVSRVGFDGVGVESLLSHWQEADSLDIHLAVARFNYYYARSEKDSVTMHDARRYLGQEPVISLNDSTGRKVNYFNEAFFDEETFGKALSSINKAISLNNTRLDLVIIKANALLAYEKESPDMTLQFLCETVDRQFTGKTKWEYPGENVDEAYFNALIMEYCYRFFQLSTPGGYEAFYALSQAMLKYNPKNTDFMSNVGSYWGVAKKNYKKALGIYRKVLKIKPDDEIAQKNAQLMEKQIALGKKK